MTAPTKHRPVLLRETIQQLELKPGLTVLDGTLGAAGHSIEIAKRIQPGLLIGLDRDPEMLAKAERRLREAGVLDDGNADQETIRLRHSSYADLTSVMDKESIPAVDRILVDLGLSSDQLESRERGFGFQTPGLLDMRFDQTTGEPILEWLRAASIAEITTCLTDYGEEPRAESIALAIDASIRRRELATADDLRELIEQVYGTGKPPAGKSHPATRTFQALRIQANSELEHLQRLLTTVAPASLRPGGLLAVISFHSLEDRMTKQAFQNRDVWQSSSKKPIAASSLEQKMNPRSRSAKLRIGIRADR